VLQHVGAHDQVEGLVSKRQIAHVSAAQIRWYCGRIQRVLGLVEHLRGDVDPCDPYWRAKLLGQRQPACRHADATIQCPSAGLQRPQRTVVLKAREQVGVRAEEAQPPDGALPVVRGVVVQRGQLRAGRRDAVDGNAPCPKCHIHKLKPPVDCTLPTVTSTRIPARLFP